MKTKLKEEELHYIWYHQKIHPKLFETTDGLYINVINKGEFNEGGGPDFFNAIIEIGGVIWAGHVEIHIKSSDWFRHKHHFDKNYDNVILHLVVEDDKPVRDIPVMLLKSDYLDSPSRVPKKVDLKNLPCATFFQTIPDSLENSWKSNRLKTKLELIYEDIQMADFQTASELLMHKSARFFGLYRNQNNMENLIQSIGFTWLIKNCKNRESVEGVLFGMSGLIENAQDESYICNMKKEFNHFRNVFQKEPILQKNNWNFSKVHPSSFPTARISQFSSFLSQIDWENLVHDFPGFEDWKKSIRNSKANIYWENHSYFNKEIRSKSIQPGTSFALRSYLNLLPYVTYFSASNFDSFFASLKDLLLELPPENNRITRVFKKEGVAVENAFDSQAVLASYKYRCQHKGCKNCEMGKFIFNPQSDVQETRIPYNTAGGN